MWGRKRRARREFEERKAAARIQFERQAALILKMQKFAPLFERINRSSEHARLSFDNLQRAFEISVTEEIVRLLCCVPEIAEVGNDWYDATYARNLKTVGVPIYEIFYLKQQWQQAERRFPPSPQEFWASIV